MVPGLRSSVLEHEGPGAMKDADRTADDRCGVGPGGDAAARGLDPAQPHAGIAEERGEHADRIRSAPDAGHDKVRQPA